MRLTGRRRRRAVWSTLGALVVVAAVLAYAYAGGSTPAPAASATATVQRGTVTVAVSASGTVQSSQTRGLSFSMSGTVTEVNVKAGDTVKAKQVLARIDATDAQDTVDSAESRVEDAEEAVTRAEAAASLPACSTTTSTTTPAAPSTGGTRSSGTTGGGGSTSQNCTQAGRNTTTDSLLQAQQQLNNAELALRQAKARLAGTVISAPIAGRVLSVGGKVGSSASPGGTGFIVLGDISTLAVSAAFSEADVGKLAVGQVASIVLPDRTDAFPAKVSQIDPAGTVSNRLVRYGVVITFDTEPVAASGEAGASADLLLGQSATVTVTTATAENVLYVSSAAVTGVANGSGTVTVRAGGRDEKKTVRVGLRGDQYTEIVGGLAEGDQVVLPSAAA